jgi:hypothetical protein
MYFLAKGITFSFVFIFVKHRSALHFGSITFLTFHILLCTVQEVKYFRVSYFENYIISVFDGLPSPKVILLLLLLLCSTVLEEPRPPLFCEVS